MPSNRNLADLGASIDSGIAGEFLTVGDSGGLFRNPAWTEIASKPTTLDSAVAIALIDSAYIQARQTDVGLDSALTTSLVDSAYIQARSNVTGLDSAGAINLIDSAYLAARAGGGLDSAGVTGIVDSSYVSARASVNSGFGTYTYFASDGQTDFSGSDVDGNVLAYTYNGIIVWYNGVQMLDTDDYTATNGTSVSLTRGADSGSSLVIGKWAISEITLPGGASTIAWGGDRAVTTGGYNTSAEIDYWSITTQANAQDFGDLSLARSAVAGTSSTTRGLTFGGNNNGEGGRQNTIDYITIATPGNATDFGDLTQSVKNIGAAGNGTRGIRDGGDLSGGDTNVMDYVTIATTGNAQDFGDLTAAKSHAGAAANATYAVFAGGYDQDAATIPLRTLDGMDYVIISVTSNAFNFGDLTQGRFRAVGLSDTTRGVFGGGFATPADLYNTMDYITIATTGNATDFGDLQVTINGMSGHSDGTYGNFAGGQPSSNPATNTIQYITIQTTGNSTDWVDLTADRSFQAGFAGNPS